MISRLLRIAISEALGTNITLNGKIVPVYHKVPDDAIKPFIEIIDQSESSSKANKDTKEYNGIVPIAVRTSKLGGGGGDLDVDLISEQIEPLIDTISITNYSIIDSDLIGTTALNKDFGKEYQNTKVLNFQFYIIKN